MIIALTGPEHTYAAGNAASRAYMNDRDFIGQPVRQVFPEIAGQQIVETFDRVYATGEGLTVAEWRMQLDLDTFGAMREFFLDITIAPLRHSNDSVYGLTAIFTDVTERVRERQRAQARAAEAERRYQAARDVVTELQETLLPTALPVLPGARIAARYLVAAREQTAGGDWFDAIPLPDGTIGLVVGDIVGHGVAASAAMGQLRAVLNRALLETADLEQAIGWADRLASQSPVMRAATVCAAVLDPITGTLRYATCGHPLPLAVVPDGTARYLPRSGGGPLGTGAPIMTATAELAPGEVVLLYSDGLIERAGELLTERMNMLAEVAGDAVANRALPLGAPASAAERASQLCVEVMTRGGYDDDITMLAAEWRTEPIAPLQSERPAAAGELAGLRTQLDDWLAGLEATQEDRNALELAISELAANVVEHAYADRSTGTLKLRAELSPDGVAVVEVADEGAWRMPGPPAATSGRGLWMAGDVVDELSVTHPDGTSQREARLGRPRGTVVTLHKSLMRPVQLADLAAIASHIRVDVEFSMEFCQGPPPVLRVAGPIDIATAAQFADRLDVVTRGGVHPVTIDLNHVNILASAGVRALFGLRDQLAIHGHPLILDAADQTPAQQILDLVGLRVGDV